MKGKELLPIFCSCLLFGTAITFSVLAPQPEPTVQEVSATVATATKSDMPCEMRGVWITYMELSMENETNQSESAFREKFAHMAYVCKSHGFNTLIVQVRPFSDALYPSDYYPPSHIMTGVQGEAASFDALAVMCDICKSFDLAIHAWINPYRVKISETPSELCAENVYCTHPEWCIETESGIILDPSNAEVRQLIENGILEIVDNYHIDGIQFDDYFYPADISDKDYSQYRAYLDAHPACNLSLQRWRELNINILLSEIHLRLKNCGKNVLFGISPQGNLDNNALLSADVVSWCCLKGFADYICPQLYFSPNNPKLEFEKSLQDWCDLPIADGIRMFAGLAGYKAGSDADEGTWMTQNDILKTEYNILKSKNNFDGFMLYSFSSLESEDATEEIENLCSEW